LNPLALVPKVAKLGLPLSAYAAMQHFSLAHPVIGSKYLYCVLRGRTVRLSVKAVARSHFPAGALPVLPTKIGLELLLEMTVLLIAMQAKHSNWCSIQSLTNVLSQQMCVTFMANQN